MMLLTNLGGVLPWRALAIVDGPNRVRRSDLAAERGRTAWEPKMLDRIISILLVTCAIVVTVTFVRRSSTAQNDRRPPPQQISPDLWQSILSMSHPVWFEGDSSRAPGEDAITVVEFTDLECPACRAFHPKLGSAVARANGRIQVRYAPFPLGYHKFAFAAASAAECAAMKRQLNQWIEALFAKQESLGIKDWGAYAQEAGIEDTSGMSDCARSAEFGERVRRGAAIAEELSLTGTPSILVDGWVLHHVPDEAELLELAERARRGYELFD